MGFFQRGLILYLFLAIALTMAMPGEIFDSGSAKDNTVLSWFNLGYNSSSGDVYQLRSGLNSVANSTASNTFGTPSSPSSGGGLLGFIDPVFQVFSWIPMIFKVLFSPLDLMMSATMNGAPSGVLLILILPVVFLMIIGLIVWIRSGFA